MHIAIISVAPPYRGGISNYTSILVKKLSEKHLVKVINYKRQYPKILFPGKSQFLDSKNVLGERCIDSINPLNWFYIGRKLVSGKFDLIIFRIWHPFFSPALGIIALKLRKEAPNTRLISLCDNIYPHDYIPMAKFLMHYVLNKMHAHIVQSNQTENELKEILDDPIYLKRLHPLYDTFPRKIKNEDAKVKLGINSNNVILFFGLIRPYKGFDILLKSIALLKDKKIDFHLLVAGECYEDKKKYINLINNLEISEFITWNELYIPDNEVTTYFSAADVVVLPYRSASQSGIAQIAYYYDVPIIITRLGGLTEIVSHGKSGFIFDPEDYNGLFDILYENISQDKFKAMGLFINKYKNRFTWENLIDGFEKVYEKI